MGTVAKLKGNGQLILKGQLDERSIKSDNGLVAHFPFDGTEVGHRNTNLVDSTSIWKVGTSGSQGKFTLNGGKTENEIITYKNPFELDDTVWATLQNDEVSDQDGGWSVNSQPIDNTKKYRLSVWIRRENVGNGTTYFGCQASTVCNLGTTTVNSNPYFTNFRTTDVPELINNWVLMVYYIHPHNYTGGRDNTSGIYQKNGSKRVIGTDFKWNPTTTIGGHRVYLFYSTSTTEKQFLYKPRFEIVDGSEASIQDLLQGREDLFYPLNTNVTQNNNDIGIEESTTNLIVGKTVGIYAPYHSMKRNGCDITLTMSATPSGVVLSMTELGSLTGRTLSMSGIIKKNGVPWIFSSRANTQNTTKGSVKEFDPKTGYFRAVETYDKSSWILHANAGSGAGVFAGDIITIENFQVEEKAFPTSFVNGSRTNGNVDIPISLTTPFTIDFLFTPTAPHIYKSNSVLRANTNVYDLLMWKRDNEDTYRLRVGGQSGYSDTVFSNSEIKQFKKSRITIVCDTLQTNIYLDGSLYETIKTTIPTINLLNIGNHDTVSQSNNIFHNLSIYSKALSAETVAKLHNNSFEATKEGNISNNIIQDDEGWQLVYHGLATYAGEADPKAYVNIGDNIEFNQIKVTCPFWDFEVKDTLTETAILKNPFAWYVKWLKEQPDANNPKIKFHSVQDGLQDVGLSNPSKMFYGYGNLWRQITIPINVGANNYLFTGNVPTYINKNEWYNTTDYKFQMDTDNWRESGTYNLTPKEYQTIQVWVKSGTTTSKTKMKVKKDSIVVQRVLEGVTRMS